MRFAVGFNVQKFINEVYDGNGLAGIQPIRRVNATSV
jgi:hypothetical protein